MQQIDNFLSIFILDAIEIILRHSTSILTTLNRKPLTKTLLYQYLDSKKVSVPPAFTKADLIKKILDEWEKDAVTQSYRSTEPSEPKLINLPVTKNEDNAAENFPIHIMSREFVRWFFNNLNDKQLQNNDFWSDSKLYIRIINSSQEVDERDAQGAECSLNSINSLVEQFHIRFNPNCDSHAGVQGRIDSHGFVLVLGCGTLHIPDQLVGTFEAAFQLMRDPFTDQNWKVRMVQLQLKHSLLTNQIELTDCETLRDMLSLPAPSSEF